MSDWQSAVESDIEDLLTHILSGVYAHLSPIELANKTIHARKAVIVLKLHHKKYKLTLTQYDPPKHRINLSPREKEVVRLVADGLSNKAIACVLEISP